MRKLKFGFTLAEVATAMTIVGVLAAIVIPLVTKNIQKQQSGSVLGRAIEQITLGNQNMIQLSSARITDGGCADTLSMITQRSLDVGDSDVSILVDLPKIIPAYWGLSTDENAIGNALTVTNFTGGDGGDDAKRVAEATLYKFNKIPAGVAIWKNAIHEETGLDEFTGYYIYIDTNGWDRAPNRAGIDVFAFKLLNNGTLIPAREASPENDTDAGIKAEEVVEAGFKIE